MSRSGGNSTDSSHNESAVVNRPDNASNPQDVESRVSNEETMPPNESRGSKPGGRGEQQTLPEIFGRYRILKCLGQGAMGSVYLAHDTQLERKVALKIPKFSGRSQKLLERFYREARSAANIRHANICPVFDIGEIDGVDYIAMAYIEGEELTSKFDRKNPMLERDAAAIVYKVALALDEAHRHNVVHRDLKPANIMIEENGEPIVMDFGLARQVNREDSERITQDGVILGSPGYMSPEQVEGDVETVGPQSDIYSLGVVLYELMTGQLPFRGSIASVMAQIVTREPANPRELKSDVDWRLEKICLKMMAKRIQDRYKSMREAADELEKFLSEPAANVGRTHLSMDDIGLVDLDDEPTPTESKKPTPSPKGSPTTDSQHDESQDSQVSEPPTDIRASRLADLTRRLDDQRETAIKLRQTHEYKAASRILKKMAGLKNPKVTKYSKWAQKELNSLMAESRKIRKEIGSAVRAAEDCIDNSDYDQAIELLNQIPKELRGDAVQDLMEEATELAKEVDDLTEEIRVGIAERKYDDLVPVVERLLELKPGHRKGRELYRQLMSRHKGWLRKLW